MLPASPSPGHAGAIPAVRPHPLTTWRNRSRRRNERRGMASLIGQCRHGTVAECRILEAPRTKHILTHATPVAKANPTFGSVATGPDNPAVELRDANSPD